MEFGKTDHNLLDGIDFRLPEDGVFTQQIQAASAPPKMIIGTERWGRKEWVGIIYPDGAKETSFLDHYLKSFSGIELNTTHYQVYPASTIEKWAQKAGDRAFYFCPKFPQSISHYSDLGSMKAQETTNRFLASVVHFGKHLGPLFLQLSEKYGPHRKEALYSYLRSLPKDIDITLEVRHPDWFKEPHRTELFALLHSLSIGLVITDVSGQRDCLHMEVTSPVTFIRFVGNGLHHTDYKRIDEWVMRIRSWLEKDLKAIHFYVHQPGAIYVPETTKYLVEQLNEKCGLQLSPPHFIETTGTLF